MTLPLDEFSKAQLVAIEIPPVALKDFEYSLSHLIAKIRAVGPHVAVIILPSLERHAQQPLWIHRWSQIEHRPFQITQTCYCRLGNKCKESHFRMMIGTTFDAAFAPSLVVSTTPARACMLALLEYNSRPGVLVALSASLLLSDEHGSPPPESFMS